MGNRTVMWAGGGYDYEPPEPPPATAVPGERRRGTFGASERLGATGLVAGRFLPLHRGHQYLIDFARASVEQLTVLVFTRKTDPISGARRAAWIRDLYPDVTVAEVASQLGIGDPDFASKFAELVEPHAGRPRYFFSSELSSRPVAAALGAAFIPVDPGRIAVPTSGSAIRANVMSNFHYLAPSVRPWFVRRIAVVGAESTGKTTLCARLREQFNAAVVPEWTRTLVESGQPISSDLIQTIARSQIASEDALARLEPGNNGGLLVCDTDLRTVHMWSHRMFEGEPPSWIKEAIADRPYDLYLLCCPDIPYVGPAERDQPKERSRFHIELQFELRNELCVELRGTREERYTAAADAIIGLYSPTTVFSARGSRMEKP
jgi:HTH-type transcriptional regulator, transcriptional repressor of NAD biosynthesis genes